VVDKVDRLQRSYKETPLLDTLIERQKIELHFHTENCIIHKNSTSQERMMWNIFVMMAQNYVDSLKDNINRAIAQKLLEGEWVSRAPIGYLHERTKEQRINSSGRLPSKIVRDELRAPLVKRLFEEYATGNYTISQLVKKTKEWGLYSPRALSNNTYLSKTIIHDMICNPFYYGVMRAQKTGKEYRHNYLPIISKDLFDQCQRIRLGWNKKPFKWGGKEYVFRGLITCAVTGRVVTALTKTKQLTNGNVGEWTYLRAYDPSDPEKMIYVKEEGVTSTGRKSFGLNAAKRRKVIGSNLIHKKRS
jgi:DNA invertase Pin-like site-specific DNA recombinase